MWSQILVITCSFLAIAYLLLDFNNRFLLIRLFLCLALFSVLIGFVPQFHSMTAVTEWAMVTGITAFLIALAAMIHYLKPIHTRFPVAFSFTPVVIILFYPLIDNAFILKELLNQLMQGGALFLTFLLYLTLINKMKHHFVLLAGILTLLGAYLLYWFGGDFIAESPWVWHVALALGLGVVVYSFRGIFKVLLPDRESVSAH